MKRFVVASFAFVFVSGSAFAADMPMKAPPVVVPPPCVWCGWYIGVNAGYAWSRDDSVDSVGTGVFANPLAAPGTTATLNASVAGVTTPIPVGRRDGFIGGGQIGYNHQFGTLVAGIEADFQALSGESSGTIGTVQPLAGFPGNNAVTTLTASNKVDWLGTLRARFGVTATPDLLLYVTGGLAYGEVKSNTTITQQLVGPATATVNGLYGSDVGISQVRAGWALGAGGEWRFAPHWSAKIEYLHYDLGSVSYTGTLNNIVVPPGGVVPTGGTFYTLNATSSARFSGDFVRVGVNYMF
jgi:outer membrane immunogenic protein